MKFETLTAPESVGKDYLIATYYMDSAKEEDLFDWVKLVAADQSAGTWTHVEGETADVVERYGAKVINVIPVSGANACVARIAFPTRNFPAYMPMIMSTVAGNVLGQDGIRLVDIEFPEPVLQELPGPQLGLEGIREKIGVWQRPLVGAILKPCIGVPPSASAEGARKAALGGADVIKDDELQSYPDYSPMEDRLRAVMEGLRSVGKEKSCLYAVNITGTNLNQRAMQAVDCGANAIMINYQAVGWAAAEDLTRFLKTQKIQIPVFGHCAGMGAYYRSGRNGIATALGVGKLARLVGMDMPLVYPDSGRFGISQNELVETQAACTAKMGPIKAACMTVAGGVHAGTVPYLMDLLGWDNMLMAGGGIYGHPMGGEAGAASILQAMHAVMSGVPLEEAAQEHAELSAALAVWGKKGG